MYKRQPQNAAATVDDSVFVGNLGHFILDVRKGQVGSILEILSEDVYKRQGLERILYKQVHTVGMVGGIVEVGAPARCV